MASVRRIVLTGGPGAGKTVTARHVVASDPTRYALVPEAATQVYDELRTRWDRLNIDGRRDVQRQIYRLQRSQEDRIAAEFPAKTLVLDRGTIDGAAYWPEGADAYWADLSTTHPVELSRYDSVVWMQTAAALGIYDGDESNSCRFEDPQAAIDSGELLARLWGTHPQLHRVDAFPELDRKLDAVLQLVGQIRTGTPGPSVVFRR
jgi:predicted ATPase